MEISSDINSLSPSFRKKFDPWRKEVISKYPNAKVFEARRSQERQNWLYAQGRTRPWKIVTRTKTSNHKDWNAVDIVFVVNWKPTRAWPYDDLIEMAKKYEIRNLKPKETCHFEDNGKPYSQFTDFELSKAKSALHGNSELYDATTNKEIQKQLNLTNNMIRDQYSVS